MASKWFYTDNGSDKPRVTIPELIQLWNKGLITEKTYVWHKIYCKQWKPIHHVSRIMDQINCQKAVHRKQPSIIIRPSKHSLKNLPNLPLKTSDSHHHSLNHHHHMDTSNNTSEINEILINDQFEGSSDSSDQMTEKIAPHIVDPSPPSPSYNNKVRGYVSTSYSRSNSISHNEELPYHQIEYRPSTKVKSNKRMSMHNGIYSNHSSEDESKRSTILSANPFHPKRIKSKRRKSKRGKSQSLSFQTNKLPKIKNRNKKKHKSQSLINKDFDFLKRDKFEHQNDENISLISQQKLLQIEREKFERERQKFYFMKTKHKNEIYAIKNDYLEQTKFLKAQYNAYKQCCDDLQSQNMSSDFIKYHKLETREKLIKDSQKCIEKRQQTAQFLYSSSTNLLQKVQNASIKMEVLSKVIDSKCKNERQMIQKQEFDRNKYLKLCKSLRNEMLNAPWLILKSEQHQNENCDYSELRTIYENIREERRKFIPIQRKWAKLIANYQIYEAEISNLKKIRSKLEKLRLYEKEFKLKMFEEIKHLLNLNDFGQNKESIQLKKKEIFLKYKSQYLCDKERQISNDLKLARLHQQNLDKSLIEIECERNLMNVEKSEKLKEFTETKTKYQNALHEIEKLKLQLNHLSDDKDKKQNYEKLSSVMESLTKQFETMNDKKEKELNEWKEKAMEYKQQSDELNEENKILRQQNKELMAKTDPLCLENEHLREQIKEMIVSNDEAIKQQEQIQNDKRSSMVVNVCAMSDIDHDNNNNKKLDKNDKKKSKKSLVAIDDEERAENMLSDDSNYEETAAALSSIRSNLCKSEKIITKHESQHSMTTIVDLVKKTKENMECQSIALTLLNDNEDFMSSEDGSSASMSVDDSFSDHLGLIEDMLNTQKKAIEKIEKEEKSQKRKEVEEDVVEEDVEEDESEQKDNVNLMHSEDDDFELNGINISNIKMLNEMEENEDEPPLFWTNGGIENDEDSFLQRMMADPNRILDDVMSPIGIEQPLSDWDDDNNDNDEAKVESLSFESPKRKKREKKKKKKPIKKKKKRKKKKGLVLKQKKSDSI